jgi:uncharacterized protein (DUF427 family)
MKIPGPDHPITVEPSNRRWRVSVDDHIIADSNDALVLTEASYGPVVYFPRKDVEMSFLSRTDRSTHCPYKGDAAYYTIDIAGQVLENAVWTYETPYPAMETIAERLAFYPDKVEVYEVDEAAVNPKAGNAPSVDEVVQHTDSGSGNSQREHWPSNVTPPPSL